MMLLLLLSICFLFSMTHSFCHAKRQQRFYLNRALPEESGDNNDLSALKDKLLFEINSSSREQIESKKNDIDAILRNLEELFSHSGHLSPSLLGDWDLIYTDDDSTRSSPFFWAFRKAFKGVRDPIGLVGPKYFSESIFMITDNIPFKSVGPCRQTFTADDENDCTGGKLISQVEVQVQLAGSSVMTTTSTWKTTSEPQILELRVEQTQVLESTVGRLLPFLDNNLAFPSGPALELIRPGSSTVFMRTTYIDDSLRICRNDEEGKVFVFSKSAN